MGLNATMRLRSPAEFHSVLRKGRRSGDNNLLISALKTEGPNRRLGLSVSKKVGGAVVRNKVKRRLREVFRELDRSAEGNWDVVISARPAAAQASFDDLKHSTFKLAERLKVFESSTRNARRLTPDTDN